MAEPKKVQVKNLFDVPNPIRVHTDLSMFVQSPAKKVPDRQKNAILKKLSRDFVIDRTSLNDFVESDEGEKESS